MGTKKVFETMVCPATNRNPRNSEGDMVELKDGRLLLAYTDFYHSAGHDMSPARISGKISSNLGKKWSEPFIVQENIGKENVMEADLLRLKSGTSFSFSASRTRKRNVYRMLRSPRMKERRGRSP